LNLKRPHLSWDSGFFTQMDLLKDIKKKRAKQKRKQPISRDVFNQICSLVREHGIKESFLSVFDSVEDDLSGENLKFNRVKLKAPMESSLFSLATKDEYSLTMSIIGKVDNAYLKFANSPEEILLCGPLYRLNPALTNQKLMRYHFETLYLHERAKIKNREI
jgi:hypothetical protein